MIVLVTHYKKTMHSSEKIKKLKNILGINFFEVKTQNDNGW